MTNVAQKGKLHNLQLFGIGNQISERRLPLDHTIGMPALGYEDTSWMGSSARLSIAALEASTDSLLVLALQKAWHHQRLSGTTEEGRNGMEWQPFAARRNGWKRTCPLLA